MNKISTIVLMLLLAGCSKSIDCSSNEAINLVSDILTKNLPPLREGKQLGIEIIDIRTQSIDKELNKASCAANAKQMADYGGKALPLNYEITYDLETTSNGKLYATVRWR